jgi:enterobacterial common antigen flippase
MRTESGSADKRTYSQILKSTSLIGGSTVVSIGFGIVRSKAIAILLGPSGIGLMSLYSSLAELTQSLAALGIPSSSVRQIAEAVGSGNEERIARTITLLRRLSVCLALVGAALLALFARPLSEFTFGDSGHTAGVALLGLAVFFQLLSQGQAALIQGMRRIADLTRMTMLVALMSTLSSIPLIYFLRENGVVPSMIATSIISALVSWWYSRKVNTIPIRLVPSQIWPETALLLKLGVVFMASGFLTLGSAYAIRLILLHQQGLEAAGLYQAAWTLGGIYTGVILQAMGADFYPRLTAVATDNDECNRLVNEQAEISLLLAAPGVIATITLAPVILTMFYTAKFQEASYLVRWLCLGMMLRIVAWPMGFIILAKGASRIFFWTEVAATLVHVGLAWLLINTVGLNGAGEAFFGLYLWHTAVIYIIARQLSGFRWSAENRKLGIIFLPLVGLVFCSSLLLPFWWAMSIGATAVCFSALYSLRSLLALVPIDAVPAKVRAWLPR